MAAVEAAGDAPGAAATSKVGAAAAASSNAPDAEEAVAASAADIILLARQNEFSVALKLLEAAPQLWTARDDDGHTLLHWAALVGNQDFVQRALAKGLAADSQAKNKQTPLMWAVLRGHVNVARALLDAKADASIRDSLGANALMIAIQHQNHNCMLVLMNRGKKDSILGEVDNNGCTAVHWAAYKGDLRGLQLLDYFGADLQALDKLEMLPLHRACMAGQFSVVEFLVEKKSDIGQRNAEKKSCLDIAADKEDKVMQSILKRLMKKSATATGKAAADVEQGGGASVDAGEEKQKTGLIQTIMKDKAAHKMFPVFWLVCVSMATFEYIMDLRLTSYEVAPTASLLFELGAPLSLAIFAVVALKDPGRIPARAKGHSGVEELMKALDSNTEVVPDLSRLCTTTWVLKDLRTKYCTQTGACVKEFDHYCVWLNTAIGSGNHREFVGLAIVEFCTQVCFIYLSWCMALSLVPYQSIGTWLMGVIGGYPLLALIVVIQCLTAPWVLMLLLHQARLVAMNLTTNEMMNMHRYGHFWAVQELAPGRRTKMFRNPFDKGGTAKNCMDFWWMRRRSDQAPAAAQSTCSGCAHGCHNHH